jgi:hypothetical protein
LALDFGGDSGHGNIVSSGRLFSASTARESAAKKSPND